MNTTKSTPSPGFTRTDLAATVAALGLVAAFAFPVLAGHDSRSTQAQCAANLRQFAAALTLYAQDNANRLPPGEYWPSDLPGTTTDPLQTYGLKKADFYCPSLDPSSIDPFWNYGGSLGGPTSLRIIGYSTTLSPTLSPGILVATNSNRTILPGPIAFGGATHPAPPLSRRLLVADLILSAGNNTADKRANQFASYNSGMLVPMRSAHLSGLLPMGRNAAMMDGHVEWGPFDAIEPRTTTGPYFWW